MQAKVGFPVVDGATLESEGRTAFAILVAEVQADGGCGTVQPHAGAGDIGNGEVVNFTLTNGNMINEQRLR